MKPFIILLSVLISSCAFNKDLKSIIHDFDSIPKCDTDNVYLHPKDTKRTLTGKVIVLNSKLDCFSDKQTITDIKIESYKDL